MNVDFPLLTDCSLVITFPPEIKIGINDVFQPNILGRDGFLSSADQLSYVPYSSTSATGTHNFIKVKNACVDGEETYPNIGSITFGNIVSPAQIKDVLEFDVKLIDETDISKQTLTYGG